MFTYADPRVCPSCREALPETVPADHRCATCDVPLGHPRAAEVFVALQRADTLVARLRAAAVLAPDVLIPDVVPAPVARSSARPPAPPLPSYPSGSSEPPQRTGVRGSSVPAILLGLGALCLLVAAVIFLAVAWSWLGVGGRTAVLVALTGATGLGGVLLHHRGLRVAGEALVSVSLGLLLLDVVGAEHAGWVGGPDGLAPDGLVLLGGLVLAVGGAVMATQWSDEGSRLAVPQVAAVAGLVAALLALPSYVGHHLLVLVAATAGLAAVAALARRGSGLAVTFWSAASAASITWMVLVLSALTGLSGADALTLGSLWGSASGPALLAAALLLLSPLAVERDEVLVQVCGTATAVALSGLVALPVLDDGTTAVSATSLALGALWAGVARAVPTRRLAMALVPGALSAFPAATVALGLVGTSLDTLLAPTPGGRLDPADPIASSWLLVPTVVVLSALAGPAVPALLARPTATVVRPVLRAALAVVALAGVATLGLHAVPVWTVVVALVALAVALAADALREDDTVAGLQLLGTGGLLGAAVAVAAPSPGTAVLPLAILVVVAAATFRLGRAPAATELGAVELPLALAGLAWVLGDLAGAGAWVAVPVLVVVGALAVAMPRPELEVTAALAGTVAAAVAVPLADDVARSLALHLTLGGALVVAHALVHPSRRPVAWVGTTLLVLATWVRLADLGVHAPEPYTLPTALLLVAVGLRRLRHDPRASSALTLLPGLSLATVPSLLQVLATDPVSARAAALGLTCLLLAVGGATLRWSAPLLVGSAVGTVLVLAELAPYAAQTPQWVVIGLAGTTLVTVGVTWERRVVELQRAAHYVGRLR